MTVERRTEGFERFWGEGLIRLERSRKSFRGWVTHDGGLTEGLSPSEVQIKLTSPQKAER